MGTGSRLGRWESFRSEDGKGGNGSTLLVLIENDDLKRAREKYSAGVDTRMATILVVAMSIAARNAVWWLLGRATTAVPAGSAAMGCDLGRRRPYGSRRGGLIAEVAGGASPDQRFLLPTVAPAGDRTSSKKAGGCSSG